MADAQSRLAEVVERNKDNVFAAYIQTAGMERLDLNRLKECYASLTDKAKATGPGRLVAARIQALEGVDVNAVAPDFTLQTPEGEDVALYGVKGKLKIIDFWASWCPPCRAEMPNLVKAYKDYKDKGFDIVGISLDSKADAWAKGVKDLNITWTQLSDLKGWQNSGAALYGVNSIPHTVLVDKDGTIIAKNLHGQELEDKIKEVLK